MENRINGNRIRRATELAILAALVIVLQMLAAVLSRAAILPFNITLTLLPIVFGGFLYGAGGGAVLGFAFGVIVLINCITAFDAGSYIMWGASPLITALLCLIKGTAAGAASGAVSSLLKKKNSIAASFCGALVAPIVNTGIFCISMPLFYKALLVDWAGGTSLLYYIFFVLVGVNFLIELGVNLIFAPFIPRLAKAVKH